MGNTDPWKTGMLILTQKEASSCITLQFLDHPLYSLHSEFLSPLDFATYETEDPFATPQYSVHIL